MRERLAAALREADAACALPFAEAVVTQVAHPLGATRERTPGEDAALRARQTEAADAVAALARARPILGDAPVLHADAVFLSACFQNMDLLPPHDCPAGDRIARRVSDAITHLPLAAPHETR